MAHPSETPSSNGLPILLIGAGSTGLALAQGLRNAGIPCIIFEKHSSLSLSRDWNMGLHWGAPHLKSLMSEDQLSRIQTIQVDPHEPTKDSNYLTFVNGSTGEELVSFDVGTFYRLRRSKLGALLSEGLDIRYNKHLSDITYSEDGKSVTAHFTDGTSETGRLLVGSDGARSTTRRLLLGPEHGVINRVPYATTSIQMRFNKEQAIYLRGFHPLFLATAHPRGNFGFFGMQHAEIEDDPTSWIFFFYISFRSSLEEQDATAHWTEAQRLAQQKEFAKHFVDPWKSALEWTPEGTPVWYMGMTDWDPSLPEHRWDNHNGLVTLVGDAAHAMTFQRGQGLNHSMADAGKLRNTIIEIAKGGDQKELITSFEQEMIARSGHEVRQSSMNTMLLHDWEKVKQSPFYNRGFTKNENDA